MKVSKIFLATAAFSLAVVTVGCNSTKKAEPAEKPKPVEVAAEPAAQVKTENPESNFKTIYFDFNKFDIRGDQKEAAMQIAEALKASPNIQIQIQGNTDDRGSTEYNMSLGARRAETLKNFLIANGVQNTIETISYGKERPVVQGQSEEAWAKNRRDDVVRMK
ncbi:OmpA family protein [Pigmentibacter ruber]|uniref:OmpA family protein n=1 Tax=Pigmentibacter ruber TaxID=2683196 RepID=UPI00131C4162|nr:OmpA family protein [Pigmentibacter ruber]BFD33092.1 hypothetical protein GTC16762_27100 [Pigmentibacter ruber]